MILQNFFNPLCWLGIETFLTLVGAVPPIPQTRFPIASFFMLERPNNCRRPRILQ